MKRTFLRKALGVGIALAALGGGRTAGAEEEFKTLAGISAETISASELAAVEGKNHINATAVLGPKGFIAFQMGDTKNPLIMGDMNRLLNRAQGQELPAVAILGRQGLLTFIKGNRNNPLGLYDPSAFLHPSSGGASAPLGLALPNLGGAPNTSSLPIPLLGQ